MCIRDRVIHQTKDLNTPKVESAKEKMIAINPDVLTEESVDVPVTAINMPDNMVLRTFPSKRCV